MGELERLKSHDVKGLIEAMLIVSGDSVSAQTLANTLECELSEVKSALKELAEEYLEANRGFQLREVAGGWRYFTHPAYHDEVERYVLSWDSKKLSQAALETLAVIAYHQPVTREGVRSIRGVNSEGVIASLKDKGLVREMGHESDRGQAILYGTGAAFLEQFGLKSLRELPPLEDFAPDEESKRFIRERLSGASVTSSIDEVAQDIEDEKELIDNYDDVDAELEASFSDYEESFDDD